MIKRKNFHHKNLVYSFNWNMENHKKLKHISNNPDIIKLWNFFERIGKGDIPNQLFNDYNLPRISQFKLSGINPKLLGSFKTKLIRQGKIKRLDETSKYSKMVQSVFRNFKQNGLKKKPNHEAVLKNILIKDEESLAIEIPVWKRGQNGSLTGHIDLIQANENLIKVIDYKPEGRFLWSLPQVATYGNLIKNLLKVKKLRCISFSLREVWEYNPEILLTDIKDFLSNHGYEDRMWEKYF